MTVSFKRAVLLSLTTTLLACTARPPEIGGGSQQPSVADETGHASVVVVDGPSAPLIVDWDSNHRVDLEAAMKQGVAVVAFDTGSMRLLKNCRVEGTYGFIGVTTKYQMVRLESQEEVRANLPLGGAVIMAKLGGELGRGRTLDVAMALIGKKSTTWHTVTPEDLQGDCGGASHFVRAATVGAFVLETGTRQQARAAAEVLGAAASYARGGSKDVHNHDGSLDACKLATSEADKPPDQCAALIRLELEPISKDAKGAKKPSDGAQVSAIQCPAGMVVAEGKCASPDNVTTYLCNYGDVSDCAKQCDAGHPESCNHLGIMALKGDGIPADLARAESFFTRSCETGSPYACVNLAMIKYESRPALAAALAQRGCAEGVASGCRIVGELLHFGKGVPKDTRRALQYYELACGGGDQGACTNVGLLYAGAAADIPKDEAKGIRFTQRACDGGVSTACGNLGLKYEFGVVVARDPKKAAELFGRACRMDDADCLRMGVVHQAGFGVARDEAAARRFFERSCALADTSFGALSCVVLNLTYGDTKVPPRTALEHVHPVMHPQCEQDVPRACTFLALSHFGLGKQTSAEMYLDAGCRMNDYWACDLKKRIRARK